MELNKGVSGFEKNVFKKQHVYLKDTVFLLVSYSIKDIVLCDKSDFLQFSTIYNHILPF